MRTKLIPSIPPAVTQSVSMDLIARFSKLADPRREHRRYYLLSDILFLCAVGVIAGSNTCLEIEEFGEARCEWFQSMGLFPNGTPSHDTIGRVLRLLHPKAFQHLFAEWVQSIIGPVSGVLAIDGKTSRGSADGPDGKPLHTVSVYSCDTGLTIALVDVREKSNEIPTIPEIIDTLDITGGLVTIDAMGCQTAIASAIRAKKADYLLAVKENQPALFETVTNYFVGCSSDKWMERNLYCFYATHDEEHGRIENREAWCSHIPKDLVDKTKWKDCAQIICNRSSRMIKGKLSIDDRYYITSSTLSAEKLLNSIREHWGIENKVHWLLDVTFAEDKCRIRKDHGPKNIATIRRWVLNLLRAHPSKKSMNIRRKKAGWSQAYLEELLGEIWSFPRK